MSVDKNFAFVAKNGDILYPYKKRELSSGRFGYAISEPGKGDRIFIEKFFLYSNSYRRYLEFAFNSSNCTVAKLMATKWPRGKSSMCC